MSEGLIIVGLIIVGLALLCLAIWMSGIILGGAGMLFAWASEQGFVGIAAYFACWIFMFPLMLIACAIFGFSGWHTERTEIQFWKERSEAWSKAEHEQTYGDDALPLSEYEKNELSKRDL